MWLNIWDFKMFDGLTPGFIAKYVGFYEILHKPHPNMYTLKLPTNFVAHPTFHILKCKCLYVMTKDQIRSKKCDPKLMWLNIG